MEDVLHHDDGRIDHDSEIDGSERDEIRRGVRSYEPAKRDEQSQRDVNRRDQRGLRVAQKYEEDERDQRHSEKQVLDHGMSRDLHERPTIVVGLDVDSGGQNVVPAYVVDSLVDPRERRLRFSAVSHEDDSLHDVGLTVEAYDAEARGMPDVDVGDVLHPHGCTFLLRDDDVFDVFESGHPRRVCTEEPDASDVVGLLAHEEALPAYILVGVLNARDDGPEPEAVAAEPIGVDFDVVFLCLSPIARHVDDAGHLLELALEHPVFDGLQVLERVATTYDAVSIELTDGIPRRQGGLHALGQRHELDSIDDLLPRVRVISIPPEIAFDVAQPEKRLRSYVLEARHSEHADFERNGHVALGLFGAPPLGLRDHFDHRGDGVRVRLDVELLVGSQPEPNQKQRDRKNDHRRSKSACHDPLNHWSRSSALQQLREHCPTTRDDFLTRVDAMAHFEPWARFALFHLDGNSFEAEPPILLTDFDEHGSVLAEAKQRAFRDGESPSRINRNLHAGVHLRPKLFAGIIENAAHLRGSRGRVEYSADPVDSSREPLLRVERGHGGS